MDFSLLGSSVYRNFQARILNWFSTPRNLPDLGIELMPLATPALEGGFFIPIPPGKLPYYA